jgi:multidrug efflux pump
MASIQDAFVMVVTPPPVIGLGTLGGFKLNVEDRTASGPQPLFAALSEALGKANQNPALGGAFSTYQINVPQLNIDVDRVKVKRENVRLSDVFETLQVYLGSLYVNDFNRFGRTYQVVAQADAPYRSQVDDVLPLKTRNANGDMVPLGSVISVSQSFGPDVVQRYNGYASADVNGGPAPGFSSGQAQAAMAKILDQTLPRGMTYEWTDLAYQQLISGNTAVFVFPLCVLFVFLVLAAQYESLSLPLAIVLIVPMCLLPAVTAVRLVHGDNNIFMQIGLLVLVGLACKNAILIVEFAKHLQEDRGRDARTAVLEAAHLRLRPILMTSMAFIMGVVPLVLATGAGAEVRHALGVTVFAGMLGVTFFGLLLTPVFYVLVRRAVGARRTAAADIQPQLAATEGSHD